MCEPFSSKGNLLVPELLQHVGSIHDQTELMADVKSQQRPREGEAVRCQCWE